MIQRIQTLYLLVATILMAMTLIFPIALFQVSGVEFTLSAFSFSGANESQSTLYMGILLALATAVPIVTIFLFKRRTLQIRLCAVEAVLLLGTLVFIGLYYWLSNRFFEDYTIDHKQFGWSAIMPVLALILDIMAARAIFKDEVLVRSLDRIR
jgi:hypothetical protein